MRDLILCSTLALGLVWSIAAAPVPPPRTPARKPVPALPAVIGTWKLLWSGGTGEATLDADGRWECEWAGSTWEGTWRLGPLPEGGRGLFVTERRAGDDGPWLEWTVILDGPRTGTLARGGNFALEPILGPGL